MEEVHVIKDAAVYKIDEESVYGRATRQSQRSLQDMCLNGVDNASVRSGTCCPAIDSVTQCISIYFVGLLFVGLYDAQESAKETKQWYESTDAKEVASQYAGGVGYHSDFLVSEPDVLCEIGSVICNSFTNLFHRRVYP